MKLFQKKQLKEQLPPQLARNGLVTAWHDENGRLTQISIYGTAESPAGKEAYLSTCGWGLFFIVILAYAGNLAIDRHVEHSGGIMTLAAIGAFIVTHWAAKWSSRETRIFYVTDSTVRVRRPDGLFEHALTDVSGVQLSSVDPQRIDEERHKKRKQKDPKFYEPYSLDIFLQTSLGYDQLGCIFGIQHAKAIAQGVNAAIQYMKGRQGNGDGALMDAAQQYRRKTAGKIPA